MEMKPHPEALLLLGQQSAQKLQFSQANEIFLFLPLKSGKILRVTFSSFAQHAWSTVKYFKSTFSRKAQETCFNEKYLFILQNYIQQNPKVCPSQTVQIYQVTLELHFQIFIYCYGT